MRGRAVGLAVRSQANWQLTPIQQA